MLILLCKIDWVAVSAIVSMLMVVVTTVSLIQNRNQLKQLKKQWLEEHRGRIILSIVVKDNAFLLKVENVGNSIAEDLKLNFCDFVKSNMHARDVEARFCDVEKKNLSIAPKTSKYFHIMPILDFGTMTYLRTGEMISEIDFKKWLESHKEDWFECRCSYSSCGNSYETEIKQRFEDFFGRNSLVIDSVTDAILETNKILNKTEKYLSEANSYLKKISSLNNNR